jgi:hypothetical protein
MIFFIILFNKKMDNEASFLSMIMAGIKITAITIVISCVATGLLLLTGQHKHQQQVPANADLDKTGGLRPMLLMNASFINFFMGLFSSFIVAMSAKRNQKTAKGKDSPDTDRSGLD